MRQDPAWLWETLSPYSQPSLGPMAVPPPWEGSRGGQYPCRGRGHSHSPPPQHLCQLLSLRVGQDVLPPYSCQQIDIFFWHLLCAGHWGYSCLGFGECADRWGGIVTHPHILTQTLFPTSLECDNWEPPGEAVMKVERPLELDKPRFRLWLYYLLTVSKLGASVSISAKWEF